MMTIDTKGSPRDGLAASAAKFWVAAVTVDRSRNDHILRRQICGSHEIGETILSIRRGLNAQSPKAPAFEFYVEPL